MIIMTQILGFHYTLKDKDGNVIDSSSGKDPLLVMLGRGQIIPGLESEIKDMLIGTKKTVIVAAKDAYGEVNEELRLVVGREQFPADAQIQPGVQFQGGEAPNSPIFTVLKVEDNKVYIDGNHMLAGQELHFDVEITEKREASDEEVAHGHAHGVGGHQH